MSAVTYKVVVCDGFNSKKMIMSFENDYGTPTVISFAEALPALKAWALEATCSDFDDIIELSDLIAAAKTGRSWHRSGVWLIDVYVTVQD